MADRLTMCSPAKCEAFAEGCANSARKQVPGDVVICGVWRGGLAIIAAAVLRGTGRHLWLYDTFDGMTAPGEHDGDDAHALYAKLGNRWCDASLPEVMGNLSAWGVQQETPVGIVAGDVAQTIERRHPERVAVAYLDTDFHDSTQAEIRALWPIMSAGGVMFFDDYDRWEGQRRAVLAHFDHGALHQVGALRYVVKPCA